MCDVLVVNWNGVVCVYITLQIKNAMEDGTFVAFCHFLADLFTSISRFSLLLQRSDIILPQVRGSSGGHFSIISLLE